MKCLVDPGHALDAGLAAIRAEMGLPDAFPAGVLAAVETAVRRTPDAHADRTDRPFVTLDPEGATDLDQAFATEPAGGDLLLHYAIADVGWFVRPGDPLDNEAWKRGATMYFPDRRIPLYPPELSEGAASLLPDGPRPAVIFTVRIAPDGKAGLDSVERAIIRSRAKLAYETATPADLPAGFPELARRVKAAEAARGAARVDPPEQEVTRDGTGGYTLAFRPRTPAEEDNAALSLACNLAVADALLAARTGLFRVMAEPDPGAIRRLRHSAEALGLDWPSRTPLDSFERRLDPAKPADAAFMLAVRRGSPGASYAPFAEGETPWHAAVAATYAHATAPLRRLADRYVVEAALAVANGRPVPDADAFERLPKVMARADALGGRIDRAVIDLAEAVMLQGRIGESFAAVVTDTDEHGARIQLCDAPVVARVAGNGFAPGDALQVRLEGVDLVARTIGFSLAD